MTDYQRAGAGRLRMAAMYLLRFRDEVAAAGRFLHRDIDGLSAIDAALKLARPEDATILPIAEVFDLFGVTITSDVKERV